MSEEKIIAFLRCPSGAVVDLAIQIANLTWKEELAIELCGRKAKTQGKAAEDKGYSPDAIQRWYRAGIEKLSKAWSGVWWIENLAEYALNISKSKGTE